MFRRREHVERLPLTRLRTAALLSAGTLDAGLASLATFLVGLVAVNILAANPRGVYAVFFAAFIFGAIIPHQLTYFPVEILAVKQSVSDRLGFLQISLRRGVVPSVFGVGIAVGSASLITYRETTGDVLLALGITMGVVVLVSPLQDHIRRMLHMSQQSWQAVLMSSLQLAVTALSLWLLWLSGVPRAWIPFGALAVANVISTATGLGLARLASRAAPSPAPRGRDLMRTGRWFLVSAGTPRVSALAAAAIITILSGPALMGYAEAARIVAQPIVVLASGLSAVLGPPAMEAAAVRDARRARRPRSMFTGILFAAALAYLLIAGIPWAFNPMQVLVPSAYTIDGLAAVTIAVAGAFAWTLLPTMELNVARREIGVALLALIATPFGLAAAATTVVTGAFAVPLSNAARGTVRGIGTVAMIRQTYRSGPIADDQVSES